MVARVLLVSNDYLWLLASKILQAGIFGVGPCLFPLREDRSFLQMQLHESGRTQRVNKLYLAEDLKCRFAPVLRAYVGIQNMAIGSAQNPSRVSSLSMPSRASSGKMIQQLLLVHGLPFYPSRCHDVVPSLLYHVNFCLHTWKDGHLRFTICTAE